MSKDKSLIPLDSILAQGVDPEDYSNFVYVLQVVTYQTTGMSLDDAIARANDDLGMQISKAELLAIPRWRKLYRIAQSLALSSVQSALSATTVRIAQRWDRAVDKLLNIIENGRLDRDKIEAFRVLQEHFVNRVMDSEAQSTERDQEEYLKKPRNFSPITIHLKVSSDQGGTSS